MSEYKTIKDLNQCVSESQQRPVLLFKHSNTCPRSAQAKEQMDQFIEESDLPVYMLIVQNERPLSNQIADTFSIQHESPQVLILRNGDVAAALNHGDITYDNIQKNINGK